MNKTFCILPWIHLCVNKDSKVFPCRSWADNTDAFGDISLQSFNDIAHSSKMNRLRSDMVQGTPRPECRQCYDRERMKTPYGTSMRQWFNTRYKNQISDIVANTNEDGSLKSPFEMRVMYIQYSNLCNMACRSCSEQYSSLWAEENKSSAKVINITKHNNGSINNIIERLHEVDFINMAGGETSLIAEHWQILDELKKLGRSEVEVHWCTNLSKIEYNKKSIIEYAKIFPKLTVRASIDALLDRASIYRHNTHWPTIEKNLKELYNNNVNVTVVATAGATNIWHIPDLHKHLITAQLIKTHRNQFTVNMLVFPKYLSAKILTPEMKQRTEIKLKKHQQWLKARSKTHHLEQPFVWDTMIKFMYEEDHTHLIGQFLEFNQDLDKKRNQNLFETFPELIPLREYKNVYS